MQCCRMRYSKPRGRRCQQSGTVGLSAETVWARCIICAGLKWASCARPMLSGACRSTRLPHFVCSKMQDHSEWNRTKVAAFLIWSDCSTKWRLQLWADPTTWSLFVWRRQRYRDRLRYMLYYGPRSSTTKFRGLFRVFAFSFLTFREIWFYHEYHSTFSLCMDGVTILNAALLVLWWRFWFPLETTWPCLLL